MDVVSVHSYWTVLMLLAFVGICVWAFSGKRRVDFERHGRIAVDDEAPVGERGESANG